jgi:phenylpropionate dioxygenase-like ring-hydroxylating dioxygenase large terminal subunit
MQTEFNWKNCWYPVVFLADLPTGKPYSFSLYGDSLVLFRDGEGRLACVLDRCPHRAARLSDGQIIDGKLECLYHGWQFNATGDCVRIPQLPPDKQIPVPACLKPYRIAEVQGMVWLWPGDADLADAANIPTIPALAQADMVCMDYVIDLPYDQTYLIENVIDVAHIHIVHDGIRGGGKREMALPLEFSILENSVHGIKSQFRSLGLYSDQAMSKINSAEVEFVAPNLIHYASNYKNPELVSGLALYSIPLASGSCRLLYRKYSNFYRWRERAKPRWLDHWTQNTILKQDMALIIGQYSEIERSGGNVKDLWLPLKTSDTLVIQYRKWLDKYAADTPFYRGYAAHKSVGILADKNAQDVFNIHTRQCAVCLKTYRALQKLQTVLMVCLLLTVPLMIVLAATEWLYAAIGCYGLGLLVLAVIGRIKRKFE